MEALSWEILKVVSQEARVHHFSLYFLGEDLATGSHLTEREAGIYHLAFKNKGKFES